MFLEKLIGTAAVLAAVEGDGAFRSAHLFPIGDFAGEDAFQLGQREFLDGVGAVDVNGQAVQGHFVLRWLGFEGLHALQDFRGFQRSRRRAQVRGVVLQRRDPGAGAATRDLNGHFLVTGHVGLRPLLSQDDHGVRTFHGDLGLRQGDRGEVAKKKDENVFHGGLDVGYFSGRIGCHNAPLVTIL